MSDTQYPDFSDNLIDLCLDRAISESPEFSQSELDALDPKGEAYTQIEMLLADLDIAAAESNPIEPPAELMRSLQAQYDDASSELRLSGTQATATSVVQSTRPLPWLPWSIAAAALIMASLAVLMPKPSPTPLSAAQQRVAFLQQTPPDQRVQWDWIVTEDPANGAGVTGDVVWSDESNKGYMRIAGLEVNDPTQQQYQLWIFDATRPEGELPQHGEGLLSQRPIDGGVFDITEDGELVIEIDAKLLVKEAAAFAVTIEPPGGVVVSDRSRVPLLALAQ
jgi:anti-sigma-K factor RskA